MSAHSSPRGSAGFLSEKPLQSHLPRLCSSSHPNLFLSCWKHLPVLQLQGFTRAEFHSVMLRVNRNFIFLPGTCLAAELPGMGWLYLFPVEQKLGGGGHSPHSALSELKCHRRELTSLSPKASHHQVTIWEPRGKFRFLGACWAVGAVFLSRLLPYFKWRDPRDPAFGFPLPGRVFVPTRAVCQSPAAAEPLLFPPVLVLLNQHCQCTEITQ